MLAICYKFPYMEGLYKLDSGDEHHFPVKGPTLTNDTRTHQIFHIIYIFLVWNVTGKCRQCSHMPQAGRSWVQAAVGT